MCIFNSTGVENKLGNAVKFFIEKKTSHLDIT